MLNSVWGVLLVIVLVLVAITAWWAYLVAHRLDRLHVRADHSWQALDAALSRRAVVARAVADAVRGHDPEEGRALSRLADAAERVERDEREIAENRLSGALSRIDIETLRPQLVAELADAEARVLIARRFHNDAVRDTLAIRTRLPVRLLHLGGTAPMPTYFEITERAKPSAATGLSVDENRISGRVVLLDEEGAVLLVHARDPKSPHVQFWFTAGGGVHPGETVRAAAARELAEETGLSLDADVLVGPIWRRVDVFSFNGELIRSEELFFTYQCARFEPSPTTLSALEESSITGFRWFTADELRALAAAGESVYPAGLAGLLAEARAAAAGTTVPEVRSIQ